MTNGGLVGRRIKIFYDDVGNVSAKEGVCSSNSDFELEIDNRLIIQKSRIVRIEVLR